MLRRHILFAFLLVLVSAEMMQGQFLLNLIDPLRQIGDHSPGIISHAVDAASKARNYFNQNTAPRIYDIFHSIANQGSHMPQPTATPASLDETKQDAGDTGNSVSNDDDLKDRSERKIV